VIGSSAWFSVVGEDYNENPFSVGGKQSTYLPIAIAIILIFIIIILARKKKDKKKKK
jgi:LPXTG-motif cell wall-anchored protein